MRPLPFPRPNARPFRRTARAERDAEERCVLCGKGTDVPRERPISLRSCYVEGCGQLCPSCYARVYAANDR